MASRQVLPCCSIILLIRVPSGWTSIMADHRGMGVITYNVLSASGASSMLKTVFRPPGPFQVLPTTLWTPSGLSFEGGLRADTQFLAALANGPDVSTFAAGTASYGISDLKPLAEHTHKFESRYLEKLIGGTFEEVPEIYKERSPLNHAHKIVSPLLVDIVTGSLIFSDRFSRFCKAKLTKSSQRNKQSLSTIVLRLAVVLWSISYMLERGMAGVKKRTSKTLSKGK